MNITDEEKRQYYKAHPDGVHDRRHRHGARDSSWRCRRPRPAGVSVGIDEEVKDKILAVRERARKGEDYAKLVGELSEAGSKANGGLISDRSSSTDLSPALNELHRQAQARRYLRAARARRPAIVLFKLESRIGGDARAVRQSRATRLRAKIYESRMDGENREVPRAAAHAGADRVEGRVVQADVREGPRREDRGRSDAVAIKR